MNNTLNFLKSHSPYGFTCRELSNFLGISPQKVSFYCHTLVDYEKIKVIIVGKKKIYFY